MTELDLRSAQLWGIDPANVFYGVSTDVATGSLGTSKHDALCADAIV